MKKLVSVLLIVTLSLQCFYKLGVIGYFLLHQEYIKQNLCVNKNRPITMCYGQCFLQRNLEVADQAEDSINVLSKLKFDIPFFIIEKKIDVFRAANFTFKPKQQFTGLLLQGVISLVFHPPTFKS